MRLARLRPLHPLLFRRCFGLAAAVLGLTVITLTWDEPSDLHIAKGGPTTQARESDPKLAAGQAASENDATARSKPGANSDQNAASTAR